MDGFDNLPNEVLCHILSFLTTKEAALTSVLSKRWLNLWKLVPNIDIDDSVFLYPEEGKREREGILQCFMDFVDKVLALQGDSPIEKFALKCETGIDKDRVNGWICNVLRRGVLDLELSLDYSGYDSDSDEMYCLPEELFESKTLVDLKLRSEEYGVNWWRGGTRTLLPMLKTLEIDAEWITFCDELENVLHAFPVLEELYLADKKWLWNETVSSASLRKLTIFASGFEDYLNPESISFDTPSLVYLEYSDFIAADYPKVNLTSLVEAHIKLMVTEGQVNLIRAPNDEDDGFLRLRNVWKLISGIRNVQKLFFTADALEVLSLCCESMPVFNNLKFLCIKSDKERGWQAMPVLLRNCPHLETLVLEDLSHYVTDKCGDACDCIFREDKGCSRSSCPVKYMKITGFRGTIKEMKMISHFLEYFPCLKEMEIYVEENDPTEFEVPGRLKLVRQFWTFYDEFFICYVKLLVSPEVYKKWPPE